MKYEFSIDKRGFVPVPEGTTVVGAECFEQEGPVNPVLGSGGGPIRNSILPDEPEERKRYPMATGLLDYFPDALAEVARVSWQGNEQHSPGQDLRWDRSKSKDEADALVRHLVKRGTRDSDGLRHTAKVAWRALALLQKEIELEQARRRAEDRK